MVESCLHQHLQDNKSTVIIVLLNPVLMYVHLKYKELTFAISKASEAGMIAWDCKGQEEVLLDLYGLFVGGDNPMQAEECSHAGLRCNYFCRTCHVGGTQEYKCSEEGYNTIFSVSKE